MKANHPQDPDLTAGRHVSYWTDTDNAPVQNTLKENLETDVVIVGGGIAGLSLAYCLVQSGKQIILVEDGNIGSGETGRTTAQLVTALDNRYCNLEKTLGTEKTKLIAESHTAAIDFIESTVKNEQIKCGFERVDGFLFQHPSDKLNSLQEELEAAQRAGVAVKEVEATPGILQRIKSLCFTGQAQFHPLQYLDGLRRCIERKGGTIFTGTHASVIDHEGITSRDGYSVKARYVVVATNSPVNCRSNLLEMQRPHRTYVIGALVKKGSVPNALWWDTGDLNVNPTTPPYHYVRVHPYNAEYDLLLSGGEDHPTGDSGKENGSESNRHKILEEWTRAIFSIKEIVYRWSGQIQEPKDGLGYIGRNPLDHGNIYIITGDSGNGMTHSTIGALLISDLINGKKNKWETIYDPSRYKLEPIKALSRANRSKVISSLDTTKDLIHNEISPLIKTGEGKLLDVLENKLGAYRAENGSLHIVSAKCTHLHCTLAWNADELSWDCPCHGSRFTYDGKVINAPANEDLPTISQIENNAELTSAMATGPEEL